MEWVTGANRPALDDNCLVSAAEGTFNESIILLPAPAEGFFTGDVCVSWSDVVDCEGLAEFSLLSDSRPEPPVMLLNVNVCLNVVERMWSE